MIMAGFFYLEGKNVLFYLSSKTDIKEMFSEFKDLFAM